ncbi:MAG: response regulator, partial [Calditrichaeota bacterium]|nr:response regulator [Calditrichota bacterium]
DMIEKIMYNLLSNALKFTPKGGTVRVKVECHDLSGQGEAAIIVRDSGIGIPAERLPHIFDRFFQVDSTATREFEGTGIGLALTKELVQLHGGGISVESAEGIGTTFTVRLPLGKAHLKPEQIADASISDRGMRIPELKDEKMPLEEITAPQAIQSETQNPHSEIRIPKSEKSAFRNPHSEIVLIVEDNPDMRAYIRDTLAGSCRILEAPHGEAGFALAQEHIPDLIITDVMMPKVDGYALTRMLRQDLATSHIPIIMLTAKAEDADKFEGLETGVDAYLTKPFSTQELQIRVRKMIERYRLLREQTGVKAIMTPAEVEVSSLDQQFLQRLQEVIEANIENHAFTVDELALQTGVNKRLLQRKVKALTDLSPIQCLRSMRLHRARQLLEKGAGNVTDVCFRVGYNDISAFSKAFSEAFGQPPSAFIARGK